jgi:hypothetical protein
LRRYPSSARHLKQKDEDKASLWAFHGHLLDEQSVAPRTEESGETEFMTKYCPYARNRKGKPAKSSPGAGCSRCPMNDSRGLEKLVGEISDDEPRKPM